MTAVFVFLWVRSRLLVFVRISSYVNQICGADVHHFNCKCNRFMIRQLKDITCMLQAMECCFWFGFVKRMVPLCILFVSFKVYSSWFMKLLLILLVSHFIAVFIYFIQNDACARAHSGSLILEVKHRSHVAVQHTNFCENVTTTGK